MSTKGDNNFGSKFMIFVILILISLTVYTCASRERIGAECWDGSSSYSTGCGTCSHHNGVMYWKYKYWWDE